MSDTGRRVPGACMLCALIALLAVAGGCRREATTAPPEGIAEKAPAADQVVPQQESEPKPDEASSKAASERARTDKTSAKTPPKADIDSHDPKYVGSTPKIAADGKPVTVLYYPPHMFHLALTRGGAEKVSVAFGTVVLVGDTGNKLAEVRIAVSDSSKGPGTTDYETLALIEPGKLRKGKKWQGSRAGMDISIEALDYGRWKESVLPESEIGWIKLRMTAK